MKKKRNHVEQCSLFVLLQLFNFLTHFKHSTIYHGNPTDIFYLLIMNFEVLCASAYSKCNRCKEINLLHCSIFQLEHEVLVFITKHKVGAPYLCV